MYFWSNYKLFKDLNLEKVILSMAADTYIHPRTVLKGVLNIWSLIGRLLAMIVRTGTMLDVPRIQWQSCDCCSLPHLSLQIGYVTTVFAEKNCISHEVQHSSQPKKCIALSMAHRNQHFLNLWKVDKSTGPWQSWVSASNKHSSESNTLVHSQTFMRSEPSSTGAEDIAGDGVTMATRCINRHTKRSERPTTYL